MPSFPGVISKSGGGSGGSGNVTTPALYVPTNWYGYQAISTGASIAIGVLYFNPIIIRKTFLAKAIGCSIQTALASSTVRMGIYTNNTASGKPKTLLKDAGTVATITTGSKIIAITPVLSLSPGVYWLAVVHQGVAGTLGVRHVGGVNGYSPFGFSAGVVDVGVSTFYGWKATTTTVTGALPTTAPTTSVATNPTQFPVVRIKLT